MENRKFLLIIFTIALLKLTGTEAYCSNSKVNNGDFYSVQSNIWLETCHHNEIPLIIKVAPFDILMGDYITNSYSFGLSVEKPIFKSYSIGFGAKYIFTDKNDIFNKAPVIVSVKKVNGFSIDSELKKYFSNNRELVQGFYWSPSAKLLFTKAHIENYSVYRYSLGISSSIGFQSIDKNKITYDFGIGISLRYVSSSNNSDSDNFYSKRYHYTDGGNKPYHEGNSIFPAITLNLKIGLNFSNAKNEKK
jgi:hypothetical protein